MSAFAEYATSTAFSITLSRPQVHMLNMLHVEYAGYCYPGWAHVTITALVRKGLIERKGRKRRDLPHYVLTEAGEYIHALCGLAGLLEDSDRRMEQMQGMA